MQGSFNNNTRYSGHLYYILLGMDFLYLVRDYLLSVAVLLQNKLLFPYVFDNIAISESRLHVMVFAPYSSGQRVSTICDKTCPFCLC